jgi:hypothetical protein
MGCGGQSKFLEDEEWTREREADGGAWREVESLGAPAETDPDRYNSELNGVRLDLSMAPGAQPTARCACIDVVVGRPADQAFLWGQEVPMLSGEQIVIALRTEGTVCPPNVPDPAVRRPSIKAVDRRKNDVIVVIEELPQGRPLAHGAITNKPKPGGSLYLRPAHKGLPYGVATGSRGRCKVYTRQLEAGGTR